MHVELYASPQAVPLMSLSSSTHTLSSSSFPFDFPVPLPVCCFEAHTTYSYDYHCPLFFVFFLQPGKKKHKDKGMQLLITDAIFFLI